MILVYVHVLYNTVYLLVSVQALTGQYNEKSKKWKAEKNDPTNSFAYTSKL